MLTVPLAPSNSMSPVLAVDCLVAARKSLMDVAPGCPARAGTEICGAFRKMNEISRNRFYLQGSSGSIERRGHGKGFVFRARFRSRRLSRPADRSRPSGKTPNPENLRVYSRMSAFATGAAHISGGILTLFLSRSEIACVRARHQAIGKLTCRCEFVL
jgi:hypothetical protein